MDTVTIRKLNSALGLLLPAVFIVLASYIGCDVSLAIAFFSLSLAVCSLNGKEKVFAMMRDTVLRLIHCRVTF